MIIGLKQTIFLRHGQNGGLENLLRIKSGTEGELSVITAGERVFSGNIAADETVELWIAEPSRGQELAVILNTDGQSHTEAFTLRAPKHWEAHLVHQSHHDPGYTDLMSHVFERHYEWIDRALDDMDAREGYPDDSRMKISVEQFWSLEYYLENAPEERRRKLYERVRRGDVELTALYGNLITEQLGGEECYRALYPSQRLAGKLGVKITSALHNDIPGVSWGLCRALCDAGIKFFAPDFPDYYRWGGSELVSYWDHEAAFGHRYPDFCHWVAPDGKKLLTWCDNHYFGGGGPDGSFSYLEGKLTEMEENGWKYDIVRVTAGGATVDNPCYIPDYADNALEWNNKYAYPHIVVSTNERFRAALESKIARNGWITVELAGDMPGQDYPIAAMSMAQITSTARRVHSDIVAAEKLLSTAVGDTTLPDQTRLINETYRDLLLTDDHAYGFHFPAGPAMRASYWEKGALAMRAEANAQDLLDKAMESVADRIAPDGTSLRLAVFNLSGKRGSRPVETPMRELDNCGTIIRSGNRDPAIRTGYPLNNRRHVNPDETFWKEGNFRLIDMESGRDVSFELDELEWDEPALYSPERCGLGAGTRRYGFFELPGGLKRTLRFIGEELPAYGYRCYALIPSDKPCRLPEPVETKVIENGVYRVATDDEGVVSIIDLRTGAELLDPACPHRLGDIIVRCGRDHAAERMRTTKVEASQGDIRSTIRIHAVADGIHELCVRLTLWKDIDRVELDIHFLRGAKPLQTMYAAFPFCGGGFKYQNMLCELEPAKTLLPGAQSDVLCAGEYVAVKGSGILWSSRDTAAVCLGHLWDGYVSTAHSCIMSYERHEPLKPERFDTGNIYALLTANNFGTNFMCSQVFDGVYRFTFGVCDCDSETDRALWGEREATAVRTLFTDRSRGALPPCAQLLDFGGLHCLTLKKAENGNGFIARLWNHAEVPLIPTVAVNGKKAASYTLCDALERDIREANGYKIPSGEVAAVRFKLN